VRSVVRMVVAGAAICGVLPAALGGEEDDRDEGIFTWVSLPDLPGPLGRHVRGRIEGAYVGAHKDALIIAGGTAGPARGSAGSPMEPAGPLENVRRDIYVLVPDPTGEPTRGLDGKPVGKVRYRWHTDNRLSRPLAYGAAVATDAGLVCIGGRDGEKCSAEVLLLKWDDRARQIEIEQLPSLPEPRAFAAAAAIGSKLYVAGGLRDLARPAATNTLWSLDLARRDKEGQLAWDQGLPGFPGEGRMMPALVAQSDGVKELLYLIGGRSPGRPEKVFEEAMRFDPDAASQDAGRAWQSIADSSRIPPGAPLIACGQAHILAFRPAGSPRAGAAQAYHTITNTWTPLRIAPRDAGVDVRATAAAAWGGSYVVLGTAGPMGPASPRVWKLDLRRRPGEFGLWNWAALGAYLLALVGMGAYFARREKTTDDFFLAGRRIPWWAAGLSIFGTALSAITFMSFPAKAFMTDWIYSLNNVVPILLVPVVIAFYIPFYRRLRVTTAYEYLDKRFNLPVRLFGSATFILFQLGRMTFVLYLPALALATVTGINVYLCIVLMGLLCTTYTVLGGIEAVIWTDVLQVVILMGAAVLSLVLVAARVEGGFGEVVRTAAGDGKLRTVSLTWDITAAGLWVIVLGNLFGALMPYTADQTVVQRYLATRDEESAGRALWVSALGGIPIALLFYGLGTALYVFYKAHPAELHPGVAPKAIYPLFIVQQMPPGVCGLVVAGIFAAAMSSVDSSMNSVATAMVTDFYRRFRPEAADPHCLKLARGVTVALGVLGIGLASVVAGMGLQDILDAYMAVFGLFGGGLAALFVLVKKSPIRLTSPTCPLSDNGPAYEPSPKDNKPQGE